MGAQIAGDVTAGHRTSRNLAASQTRAADVLIWFVRVTSILTKSSDHPT